MNEREKRALHGCGLVRQSVEKLKSNSTQKIHLERALDQFSKQYELDLQLVEIYEEKKSGRKTKFHLRDSFHQLERKVANREIDFVIFESVTRLGRWDIKNKEFVGLCHENDVLVFFADHGRLDLKKKADRIKFGLDSILAEEGSNEISERVSTKGRTNSVVYGKDTNTTPILGLNANPRYTGQYLVDQKGAKIIDEMIEKFIETEDYSKTAEYLNGKGYRTHCRQTKERPDSKGEWISSRKIGGEKFDSNAVKRHLTSKKLRGWNHFIDDFDQFPELQDKNRVVKWQYGYAREHGPIISEELANHIDSIIARRKHKRSRQSKLLLSDILETPDGIKYRGTGGRGERGTYYHYYEVPKRFRKSGLEYEVLSANEVEPAILMRANEYVKSSGLLSKVIGDFMSNRHLGIAPMKEQIASLESDVEQLTSKVKKYTEKIDALILDEDIDKQTIKTIASMKVAAEDELITKSKELKDIKKRVQQTCNTGREEAFKNTLKGVLQVFKNADLPKKRELLQIVFPKIVVYPEGRLHLELNLALQSLHLEKKGSIEKDKWLGRWDSNPRPID